MSKSENHLTEKEYGRLLLLAFLEQHVRLMFPVTLSDAYRKNQGVCRDADSFKKLLSHQVQLREKVAVSPHFLAMTAPEVPADTWNKISRALINERKLLVRYHRSALKFCDYLLSPLAMVQEGNIFNLYCLVNDYDVPRFLALHRMRSVRVLEDPACYKNKFGVIDLTEVGLSKHGTLPRIWLELIFDHGYGDQFEEILLGRRHQIQRRADGRLVVSAEVPDSPQLLQWILGLGSSVEVVEPVSLRKQVARIASEMSEKYLER